MKKILIIILLSILHVSSAQSFNSFGQHKGQGDLKITKNEWVFDILELYFSAGGYGNIKNNPKYDWQKKILKGPRWNGEFVLMSKNAKAIQWQYNTHGTNSDNAPNYLGKAVKRCKKQGHGDCFVFAIKNKIVWQNDINPKKGTKIKKKDARKGVLTAKLKEHGFLDDDIIKKKTKAKITKKKSENKNVVTMLKDLKKLLDDGVISKEEFEKAKKKILN